MSTSPPSFTVPADVALEAAEEARSAIAAQVAGLIAGEGCVLDFDGDAPSVVSIQLVASARRSLIDAGCPVSFGPAAEAVFAGARDGEDAA